MSALIWWFQKLSRCWRREDLEKQKQEQAQTQMLLTLRDLQRTNDPLVAAQVYNKRHSPLCRLPEELLLHILHCIGEDAVSLCCLRRVSRLFRRLINEPVIWKRVSPQYAAGSIYFISDCCYLSADAKKQLQQCLRRDGMCDRCHKSSDPPFRLLPKYCNFSSICPCPLYCDACGSNHNVYAFSFNQDCGRRERTCLGRQGAVQLCEHIHISWATVEAHISRWQQRSPGDWQACFDNFNIECRDPSHDTRCTAEEPETWPRARLQTAKRDQNLVVLNLEWTPHSGLDAFTLTPDARVPVTELRALFQRYRQGPASILFPSYPSNPLPEMVCFGPTKCICLHYEMETDWKMLTITGPSGRLRFFRDDRNGCISHHWRQRRYGYGHGQKVRMRKHWPRGEHNPICLVTIYQQDVLVCRKTDRNKFNPTHEWYHAMDPATHTHPSSRNDSPLCKDASCMKYYRSARTRSCTQIIV
ncbi:hypothetical protein F5Y13DRAFT_95995 [Hypoxylon sp. FL1857]|nr:hypothetical protein F5Y13DRAFT_95995 [Hypoxylon sp. FL1857]